MESMYTAWMGGKTVASPSGEREADESETSGRTLQLHRVPNKLHSRSRHLSPMDRERDLCMYVSIHALGTLVRFRNSTPLVTTYWYLLKYLHTSIRLNN